MTHKIDQQLYKFCQQGKDVIIEYDEPVTSFWERLAFLFGYGRIYIQMDVKCNSMGTRTVLKNHIAFLRK